MDGVDVIVGLCYYLALGRTVAATSVADTVPYGSRVLVVVGRLDGISGTVFVLLVAMTGTPSVPFVVSAGHMFAALVTLTGTVSTGAVVLTAVLYLVDSRQVLRLVVVASRC